MRKTTFKLYRVFALILGAGLILYGLENSQVQTHDGSIGAVFEELKSTGELKSMKPPADANFHHAQDEAAVSR